MWKDIKGFEGQYEMSDTREVRRKSKTIIQHSATGKEYKRVFPSKIVKQWIDNEGYLAVALNGDSYRIHWLYYNTFIGDSAGYVVDHMDRDRLNNEPSNLRLLDYTGSVKNRTLAYKPDITFDKRVKAKPYYLRFTEDGERKSIGYYSTYEEAENKYRELYNERQKKIDASSKVFTINS